MTFENKVSSKGIYYSQYIASWVAKGGDFNRQIIRDDEGHIEDIIWCGKFRAWLKKLGLKQKEIKEIAQMADNGCFELEESAARYLDLNGEDKYEYNRGYQRWKRAMIGIFNSLGIELDIIGDHVITKEAQDVGIDLMRLYDIAH